MKYFLLFQIIIFLISCENKKECTHPPDCNSGPEQLRFVYFDRNDQNMLEPNYPEHIKVKSVWSKLGVPISYEVSNIHGGTQESGFSHLSLTQTQYSVRPDCDDKGLLGCFLCINEECELYISYYNRPEIDTLNVLYERVIEYDENNCPCTCFPLRYINFNGKNILNDTYQVGYGAWIIRKE